jgi:hypothetical protein
VQIFADKKTGRMPEWLGTFTDGVSRAVWGNYERVWKPVIGSGETTGGRGSSVTAFRTGDISGKGGAEMRMWYTDTDTDTLST